MCVTLGSARQSDIKFLPVLSLSDRAIGDRPLSGLSSLLEPRYLGEPLLLKRRHVAGVNRRGDGLTSEPASPQTRRGVVA